MKRYRKVVVAFIKEYQLRTPLSFFARFDILALRNYILLHAQLDNHSIENVTVLHCETQTSCLRIYPANK